MNSLKAAAAFGLTVLLANTAAAQNSAASSPVGYETITIDQDFNYLGLRLLGAVAGSGVITGVNGSDISTDVSVADGTYLLEVESGAAAGAVELVTVSANVVASSVALAGDVASSDSVVLRTPQSLSTVFGDPPADSVLDSAAGAGAADLVLVPDGVGGFATYFFSSGGFGGVGAGWMQLNADGTVNEVDGTTTYLVYTDGIIVQNRGNSNSLVVAGSVKTTPTNLVLTSDFNYLGTAYPAGATLSSAFDDPANPGTLREGAIDGASGAGASDLVLIPNGASFDTYFFSTGGFGGVGAGWQQVTAAGNVAVDSTTISLDTAASIIIQNRGSLPQSVEVNAPDFYSNL